jgi:hypothetical protein
MTPLVLPVSLLRRARLELGGVEIRSDSITFAPDPDCVDLARGLKRGDIVFWNKVADAIDQGRAANRDPDAARRERAIHRLQARRLGKGVPGASPEAIEGILQSELDAAAAEFETRAQAAHGIMRRLAFVSHEGGGYLLSTLDPSRPLILAQAAPGAGARVLRAAATIGKIAELILELLFGLLTLMGAKLKANINLGKWLNRLVDLLTRNPRLRAAALKLAEKGASLGVKDLADLLFALYLHDGVGWECLKEMFMDILDLSFWGVIKLLGKLSARSIPGAGQALLFIDLGIVVVELVVKIRTW